MDAGKSRWLPSRRLFLGASLSLGAQGLPRAPEKAVVCGLATAEFAIDLTVDFYDRYSSSGFWFDGSAGKSFCLSPRGEDLSGCPGSFIGSLAIARYKVGHHFKLRPATTLREHVRTIDQDGRLEFRPPFDRTIELREGVASDIQAFGYETAPPPSSASARLPESGGPWYYFRQDLYLGAQNAPFLVVHWRHAFGAIRILDLVPGEGTWFVRK